MASGIYGKAESGKRDALKGALADIIKKSGGKAKDAELEAYAERIENVGKYGDDLGSYFADE